MIGHHTRLQEYEDLPLWQGPVVKKNRHFLMHANHASNYVQ